MTDKIADWVLFTTLIVIGLPTFIMVAVGVWMIFLDVISRVI